MQIEMVSAGEYNIASDRNRGFQKLMEVLTVVLGTLKLNK